MDTQLALGIAQVVPSDTVPPGAVGVYVYPGKVAWVDADDAERVAGYEWRWHAKNGVYAVIRNRTMETIKTVKLSRLVMDAPKGMHVDHIHHNQLDNRKSQLRITTHRQNQLNKPKSKVRGKTSKYKGVIWRANRWEAKLTAKGVNMYLGRFRDEDRAARAYDDAARKHFGEFAYLNFPDSQDNPGGTL